MTREEKIDIISDKYAHDIVMQRKEYPCLPLSKRMELTKFDGYEIAQAFEDGMKYADAHPHWISVEDELPKERDWYLIYDTNMGHDVCMWYGDCWGNCYKVTHWMPLPAPPVLSNSVNTGKDLKGGEQPTDKIEPKKLDPDKVIEWLNDQACLGWIEDVEIDKFIEKFKKDLGL